MIVSLRAAFAATSRKRAARRAEAIFSFSFASYSNPCLIQSTKTCRFGIPNVQKTPEM